MTKPKPVLKSKPVSKAKPKPAPKVRATQKFRPQLPKAPTGIQGLDEITGGGLPKGRPTLVCGGAGCGKTLLAMEFLVRGATEFNEPGVFMAFEETAKDLTKNVASLGFDLKDLVARKKIVLGYVYIERSKIEESGEYDLEGLFIRLGAAIDAIGAKRVMRKRWQYCCRNSSRSWRAWWVILRGIEFCSSHGTTCVGAPNRSIAGISLTGLETTRFRGHNKEFAHAH